MINNIAIIPIIREVIIKATKVPVMPIAAIRSRVKIQAYMIPTNFVTYIPKSN